METNKIVEFEQKHINLLKGMTDVFKMKKIVEKKEKEFKEAILKTMEELNLSHYENDYFKITYVLPTTQERFDSANFKKEYPEVAQRFTKTVNVKGSVRVTLK